MRGSVGRGGSAAVFHGVVTAGAATATVVDGLELDRHLPTPTLKRDRGGRVPDLIAAVDLVAGSSSSPLFITVDVYVVKVALAIAEVGQSRCFLFQDYPGVVAVETQCVTGQVKRLVELRRELLAKQGHILRGVRVVTRTAVAHSHRTVKKAAFQQYRAHIRNRSSVLGLLRLVVAAQTEHPQLFAQEEGVLPGMWVVAVRTVFPHDHGPVQPGRLRHLCANLRMAFEAKLIARRDQRRRILR